MSNTIKIKQIDQTELAAFVNDLIDGTGAVYTANRALISDGTGDVTTSSVTSTEVGYLSGVTSAIQTQLNNKLASSLTSAYVFVGNGSNIATGVAISGDITLSNAGVVAIATGVIVNADVNVSAAIALSKLAATTASRALVSDASGFVSASSVTATELGYVSGVSSAIQTQFNNLGSTYLPLAGGTMTGALNMTSGQVYKYNGVTAIQAITGSNDWFFGGAGNLTLSGTNNTGVGGSVLGALTTGTGNVGFGKNALVANQTGDNNLGIGYYALYNTTSSNNVGLGTGAGYNVSTGIRNFAIGTETLYLGANPITGNENIAIGYQAGRVVEGAAASNILIGSQAGSILTTGSSNTFIGFRASASSGVTTGSNNIFIGYQSGYGSGNISNTLIVGDSGVGTIITGDLSTGRVNVGWVNTMAPTHAAALHVFIKTAVYIGLQVQAASSQSGDLTRWLASDGTTILSSVASDGVITAAGYKSSDGSAGATGTATAVNTLTIKNGLVTNIA